MCVCLFPVILYIKNVISYMFTYNYSLFAVIFNTCFNLYAHVKFLIQRQMYVTQGSRQVCWMSEAIYLFIMELLKPPEKET